VWEGEKSSAPLGKEELLIFLALIFLACSHLHTYLAARQDWGSGGTRWSVRVWALHVFVRGTWRCDFGQERNVENGSLVFIDQYGIMMACRAWCGFKFLGGHQKDRCGGINKSWPWGLASRDKGKEQQAGGKLAGLAWKLGEMESTAMVRLWPGCWLHGLSSRQRYRPKKQKK
jgi:hypothetical protein